MNVNIILQNQAASQTNTVGNEVKTKYTHTHTHTYTHTHAHTQIHKYGIEKTARKCGFLAFAFLSEMRVCKRLSEGLR